MNKIMCFFSLFIISCVEHLPTEKNEIHTKDDVDSSISICYNINSKEHGNICSESCLEPGSQTAFCWDLYLEDCQPPLVEEWQHKVCHFFD